MEQDAFNSSVKRLIDSSLQLNYNIWNGIIVLNSIIITALAVIVASSPCLPQCIILISCIFTLAPIILIFLCYYSVRDILNISLRNVLTNSSNNNKELFQTDVVPHEILGKKQRWRKIFEKSSMVLSVINIVFIFLWIYLGMR